jgi:hypothetical protein
MKELLNSVSTIYPQHPVDSRVLVRYPEVELALTDRLIVTISSLVICGSFVWVPALSIWLYRRWKAIPKEAKRRRRLYGCLLFGTVAFLIAGPHRSMRVGEWLQPRKWKMWDAWSKFLAIEIIADTSINYPRSRIAIDRDKAILAFAPHGIFPFSLAFAALPDVASNIFGPFRPVIATAANLLPFVNTFVSWIGKV